MSEFEPSAGADTKECPYCAETIKARAIKCRYCGSDLTAEAPAAAPAASDPAPAPDPEPVATERRLVSVLFADLVGFTTLSEGRDSEQVRELQSQYFDTCRRLIGLYGGTVEKFIGDAVMAVWGTPTATEDDAERAVRTALDLLAAVTALGDELGVDDLRARAGVLTGEATVTIGAAGEGMVTGDLVNTASRVQSLAGPGQVLVGDPTRRATEPTVAYEDAGSHELKGKAGLHHLWRAVRVVSGARGALKSEGLEAPFVGRDREWRQVKDLFHACADERRAHLVSVTGIAGIGKSRLVWEFFKYFDGLPQIVYWHRGRCLSYGEGVTYWALADMVRMRCRIAEDEQPDAARQKLADVLTEHITDTAERAFVEPRVAHLLGVTEGSSFEREELFAAWRVFFERLADLHPVVLAFEDMQWADASLLDFVEYLLDWSRSSPLFIVTAARPELVEKRPTWGAGKRNFTSMYLEPLPEPVMAQLLSGLAPGLPQALSARILTRAEGVPLYAVETVRMLLDRGLLVQEGSVYRPSGEIDSLEVPETLHALIAARLDGLTGAERRLVQDGAVLGKTFTKQALAALSDVREQELEPLLQGLVRKEVLSIQADPRSPERGQYGFLQDLVRRVAYETLSRRERRARHLAAAAFLEATSGDEDELVEVIASHYLDAHAAGSDGDGADEVRERARVLLERAGDHAAGLAAAAQASRYFEQAAELEQGPPVSAALLGRAGEMATRAGELDRAADLYERARELFDRLGDRRSAALIDSRAGWLDQTAGRIERGRDRLEAAFAVLSADAPDGDLATVASRLAQLSFFVGDLDRCSELSEQAMEIGESLGLPDVLTRAWTTRAQAAMGRGRPHMARALLRASLDLALEHGITTAATTSAGNLSDLAFNADRYGEALVYLEQVLGLARSIGDRPMEWFVHSERTYALFMPGRWDEAITEFSELPEELLATGGTLLSPLSSILEVHLYRGDLAAARRLHSVYGRLESTLDVQERGGWDAATAALLHAEGRHADALAAGRQAVEARSTLGAGAQAVKQGFVWAAESALALDDLATVAELAGWAEALPPGLRPPLLEAHALRLRGRLTEGAEADRLLDAAAARFASIDVPFWLAVTRLTQAERRSSGELPGDPAAPLDEAREIFDRLAAAPWQQRVAAVAGTPAPVPAG